MTDQLTLFLSGDVMLGRGLDQILPHSNDPVLYESYVKDARHYVELAERVNGLIDHPVTYDYPWGFAMEAMSEADARIINLETSITKNQAYEDKGINYRMHPDNIPCLTAARIDCCVLANNHVLDWGRAGLLETLETLEEAGIPYSGAGRDHQEASSPAILKVGDKGRILIFSFGSTTSGIPRGWKARKKRPGLHMLENFSSSQVDSIRQQILAYKEPGDVVVASLHWGSNWGYDIPRSHQEFAHGLIDNAGVDVVHGHSSHHVLGIEVYKEKPILYGCGDLLNDYEGIGGHESYKAHLGFLYFATLDTSTGNLVALKLVPTQVKKLQLVRPNKRDREWLQYVVIREGAHFGTRAHRITEDTLQLTWQG